jgi:hypothetical protein
MDLAFMVLLQSIRTEWGRPIRPVKGGGYRCLLRDGKAGVHTEGRAVDVDVGREDYHSFMEHALYYGFTGIGIKNHGGRFQLHIDNAESQPGRPRPWVWTYP